MRLVFHWKVSVKFDVRRILQDMERFSDERISWPIVSIKFYSGSTVSKSLIEINEINQHSVFDISLLSYYLLDLTKTWIKYFVNIQLNTIKFLFLIAIAGSQIRSRYIYTIRSSLISLFLSLPFSKQCISIAKEMNSVYKYFLHLLRLFFQKVSPQKTTSSASRQRISIHPLPSVSSRLVRFLTKEGRKEGIPRQCDTSTCCRGIEFPFSSAGTFVGAISLVERFGRFRSAVNYGNGEECLADIIFPRDGSFNIVGFLAAGGMPRFRVENHLAASDSRSRARSKPAQNE